MENKESLGVDHDKTCTCHEHKNSIPNQKIQTVESSASTCCCHESKDTNASLSSRVDDTKHAAVLGQESSNEHVHEQDQEHESCGCGCHGHNNSPKSQPEHTLKEHKCQESKHKESGHDDGCACCCSHNDGDDDEAESGFLEHLESAPAVLLAAILLVASLVVGYFNIPGEWILTLLVCVICGLPILANAISRLWNSKGILKISSSLLVSLAIIAAIAIGDYFAAAEVAFIMAIGEKLEDWTVSRTRRGIRKLVDSAPANATRLVDGQEEVISVSDIKVGDILRVRPGEMIPADGIIIKGSASIDASSLTGESVPEAKDVGDEVMSGTISTDGALELKALRPGTDGSLQRIINIVRDANQNKAHIQTTADKWASVLVPLSFITALCCWVVTGEVIRAVAVLVVFCPCALVLATPTAIIAAIGQAAKYGVIIKSGAALERMAATDVAVFDKTGTLTMGQPECVGITIFDSADLKEEEVLPLIAASEEQSEHPLAKALVRYAKIKVSNPLPKASAFGITAGRGIKATVLGRSIICGSVAALKENGISLLDSELATADKARQLGQTVIFAAVDSKAVCSIAFSDKVKENAKTALLELKATGITPIILSGDHKDSVAATAAVLGVTEFKAGVLPSEKLDFIKELQQKGHSVMMSGDGINDAPALKMADVGVAMGVMGSDLALEASDAALMKDDLSRVPYLKRLASACANTIKLGICISLVINFVAILLSFLGVMTPAVGAVVHNAGSCFVIMFASLLYDRKLIKNA